MIDVVVDFMFAIIMLDLVTGRTNNGGEHNGITDAITITLVFLTFSRLIIGISDILRGI